MGDETTSRLEARRAALAASKQRDIEERDAQPRDIGTRTGDEPVGVMAYEPLDRERADAARELTADSVTSDEIKEWTRRSRDERSVGRWDVPRKYKKPGFDYQWITISVLNTPTDGSEIASYSYDGGWRHVPARDMPEMAPDGCNPMGPIDRSTQRLMHRPMTLTNEAKEEDAQAAMAQFKDRAMAAGQGVSTHKNHQGMGISDPRMRVVPGRETQVSVGDWSH